MACTSDTWAPNFSSDVIQFTQSESLSHDVLAVEQDEKLVSTMGMVDTTTINVSMVLLATIILGYIFQTTSVVGVERE
eukprot:m.1298313 g.1298313  ORF g.1298313 m.1298313 type:complete len:78 (-) comp24798_c1_seq66:139-372(-)